MRKLTKIVYTLFVIFVLIIIFELAYMLGYTAGLHALRDGLIEVNK